MEADVVRQRIADHVRALRDGLLGLPDRLSSSLAAETDQRKVHVLLTAEILARTGGAGTCHWRHQALAIRIISWTRTLSVISGWSETEAQRLDLRWL
jgi:hypothetical protein